MPIKILTYNVAMLRGEGKKVRAYNICRRIKEEKYDVICFQEVFDEDIRDDSFVVSLSKVYPESSMVVKASDNFLKFEDSGLFFASKFPMSAWDFMSYKYSALTSDIFADKGLMGCRLDISSVYPGQELFVFNSHLQSDYEAKYPEIRKEQFLQISEGIRNWLFKTRTSGYQNTSAILFGDLNVIGAASKNPGEDAEYFDMIKTLSNPRDLFTEKNPGDPGYTWDDLKNKFKTHKRSNGYQERLDYALAFNHIPIHGNAANKVPLKPVNCSGIKIKKFKSDDGKDLSDHYGLELIIDF